MTAFSNATIKLLKVTILNNMALLPNHLVIIGLVLYYICKKQQTINLTTSSVVRQDFGADVKHNFNIE